MQPTIDEKVLSSPQNEDVIVSESEEIQMKRNFGLLRLIALGFNTSDSWVAVGSSIPLAIAAGGTVSLLYGIIVVSFTMLCTGFSLAELASIYPTAGGQYHLTSILAPKRRSRGLSYVCGLTAVLSWIAIAASVSLIITEFTFSLVISYNPAVEVKPWQYFLLYQAAHVVVVLYNLFMIQKTAWIYDFTCGFSLLLFIITSVVCPVLSSSRPDTTEVWSQFINSSGGWPNGISFLIGLSTPSYMLVGLDATMHLAEECTEPARVIPKAIISTVIAGIFTAFTFAVAMCYSHSDFSSLLDSPIPMPLYSLWEVSTNSKACATVFTVGIIWIAFFGLNAVHQTASRLTWAFACDNGLVFSTFLDRIDPKLKIPVYALGLNYFACFLIGFLYLASSSAFNAFIGTANILSTVSIATPVALILYQGRSSEYLPANRSFRLPRVIGFICNSVTVVWATLITIFFCFPTVFPVTGANMNYSAPVLVVMFLIAAANWMLHGRKHYNGPRLEDD